MPTDSYPLHPDQTHAEPYYCTIPLEEYESMKKRIAELEKLTEAFRWRSYKNEPPPPSGQDDFIFCGHQKYDYESDDEMEYFVGEGHLDFDGTLCMNNDWWEGQQLFEIDYWFPLPRHPDEPKRKLVNGKWIKEEKNEH